MPPPFQMYKGKQIIWNCKHRLLNQKYFSLFFPKRNKQVISFLTNPNANVFEKNLSTI